MSYTVKYDGTKVEKMQEAYKDAVEWFKVRYREDILEKIEEHLKADFRDAKGFSEYKKLINGWEFTISFAGISGLPVRAIIRHAIYGKI